MTVDPPTADELQALSNRLMLEFEQRFNAAGLDLSIGRMRSALSRGIGLEVNGEWDSFIAARRLFPGDGRFCWTFKASKRQLGHTLRPSYD